ncbi:hypothetical protein [Spiroplasma attinicola]|uniref:hypothetical protein n=1 Tax=Spiroplasma attinicola TaxID=2904537 RepID=UPI002022B188|nr:MULTISPECIES: hypothetical protein [unclassified Spiroplasma]MCL8209931.1 hypothetical protein [Spiroplasma sp. JKS002670]MCL8210885.1 hypothetical protein [Spiroplasma sp. JKS002671]
MTESETKIIEVEKINQEIKNLEASLRDFEYEQKKYSFKKTDFQENPSNLWLRFFLGFFTCFLSFLGFVSKEEALIHKEKNKNNLEWNQEHKIDIDQQNEKILKEIKAFNKKVQLKINRLKGKLNQMESSEENDTNNT